MPLTFFKRKLSNIVIRCLLSTFYNLGVELRQMYFACEQVRGAESVSEGVQFYYTRTFILFDFLNFSIGLSTNQSKLCYRLAHSSNFQGSTMVRSAVVLCKLYFMSASL